MSRIEVKILNFVNNFSLHRIRSELDVTQQREKETVAALHDAEEVLAKRRAEIARMRDQVRHLVFMPSSYFPCIVVDA